MTDTNKVEVSKRDLYFFRQRLKNKIFQSVVAYFAKEAKAKKITKKDLAIALGKDPAQITRWLSGPNNWTLDTISDLLLALNAELHHEVVSLHEQKNVKEENVAKIEPVIRTAVCDAGLSGSPYLIYHQMLWGSRPTELSSDETVVMHGVKKGKDSARAAIAQHPTFAFPASNQKTPSLDDFKHRTKPNVGVS